MRVNVYAEEITQRVALVSKIIEGRAYVGVRFYLELPVSVGRSVVRGPFLHHEGDDDSSGVTFWGSSAVRAMLVKAIALIDEHAEEARRAGAASVEQVVTPQRRNDEYEERGR